MGISLRDVGLGIVLAAVLLQGWKAYEEMNRRTLVTKLTKRDTSGKTKLTWHSDIFKKEVIKVTPSREVMAAFRKITKKPVKAIIYTHNHPDHVNGAQAFLEEGQPMPQVWAHHQLLELILRQNFVGAIFFSRAMRQFGVMIPDDLINAGIGPSVRLVDDTGNMGLIYPDNLMTGIEQAITVAGIEIKLVHIPGETEDQIGVWVPKDKAFLCADDVYQAFPNLYAIRGTPTRDTMHWVTSLDRIISYRPEYLVPSHTRAVVGEKAIAELLTGYRDAIQFVHDQTIRYMNKGYLPDEIADIINIPAHLASHPYLIEFYGTAKWSVKGVFNGYMGWFTGDPVDLGPLTPNEMAERHVRLAGGVDNVVLAAQEAMTKEEWQWGLVLSSYVLRVDKTNVPAKEVKFKCLMELGEKQVSSNGRNYYITSAFEVVDQISTKFPPAVQKNSIQNLPLFNLFKMLQVRWNAEACGVINSTLHFRFTDVEQDITVTTRNAIVLVSDGPPKVSPEVKVTTSTQAWRDTISSSYGGLSNFATGALKVDGGMAEFTKIMGCFDKGF